MSTYMVSENMQRFSEYPLRDRVALEFRQRIFLTQPVLLSLNRVKMMKRPYIFIFLLSLFVLITTASPMSRAENPLSEKEMYNQAYDFSITKNYQKAVEMLHKLLTLYPRTTNEEVYWKLSQIYDENLYDYQKALEVYHLYLAKFPDGRFYANFRDRAVYLAKNRGGWDAIREYKQITDTSYTRTNEENIKMMREVLKKYPETAATPDMYYWLASQYHQTRDYRQASFYSKKYIGTFPANGKTNDENIIALKQYSTILAARRQYKAAFGALKETLKYHVNSLEYSEALKVLRKEQALWIGLWLSIFCITLFLVFLVFANPLSEIKSIFEPVRMGKWILLLIAGTLLPMFGTFASGYGIWKAFYGLAAMSSVVLVLIKLSSPLARKLNRASYLFICFLLIIAGIYLTFYWADNLSIFYQQAQQ